MTKTTHVRYDAVVKNYFYVFADLYSELYIGVDLLILNCEAEI